MQLRTNVRRSPTVLQRPIARCDWSLFSATLDQRIEVIDSTQLNSSDAVEERGEELAGAITAALDVACPKQAIKAGAFRVTKATLQLIKLKRRVRKLHQDTGDPLLNTAYNNLNRRVKAAVAKEKREAWQRETEKLNHLQGAKLWKSLTP